MSTPRPSLPDALLRQTLAHRASGPSTPTELLEGVLAAVETLQQRRGWLWRLVPQQRLSPVLIAAALLLAGLIGFAAVAGSGVMADRDDIRTQRELVPPFLGLPPEGATPSTPDEGELVLRFFGRFNPGGPDHWMWLYADGRLIWSNSDGRDGIGLIEQRLTQEGVDLVRSEVMATTRIIGPANLREDPYHWTVDLPGLPSWGGMVVRDGDQLFEATWSDPGLPGRLVDPASWLPASAWDDQRIGGYVPSRYAACLEDLSTLDLPERARALLVNLGEETHWMGVGPPEGECYEVTTEAAREIAAALGEAGTLPDTLEATGYITLGTGSLWMIPILPDGEQQCICG